ncbi:unnamed protein product [Phytophthora fragariaefolia]|uniref:Unnamed protein product n=1 Tax=Phytophthora fragariaefolia TaxID=1490495 RepID=A0A9W6WUE6_9STRA|nr:unnamed protein product [Phytophthora fragariaefolia]
MPICPSRPIRRYDGITPEGSTPLGLGAELSAPGRIPTPHYDVISGYDVTDHSSTLHLVCTSDSVRFPLSFAAAVIKADVLNYALRTRTEVNSAAVMPMELVVKQSKIIASSSRRRPGPPTEVTDSLSVPFNGD